MTIHRLLPSLGALLVGLALAFAADFGRWP
jgi:hypothetical protein